MRRWEHLAPKRGRRFDPTAGFRDRRSRGTRIALDAGRDSREFMLASVLLYGCVGGGFDLLTKPPLWQKGAGLALLAAVVVVLVAFFRWYMKPIDDASLRKRYPRRQRRSLPATRKPRSRRDGQRALFAAVWACALCALAFVGIGLRMAGIVPLWVAAAFNVPAAATLAWLIRARTAPEG